MRIDYIRFNPYRVFKFVATYIFHLIRCDILGFQSLSGFQVRCNFEYRRSKHHEHIVFQSLSGFQVRCNSKTCPVAATAVLFQSLSGFQVRCNGDAERMGSNSLGVSIPIGFSSSLQHRPLPMFRLPPFGFQSLSGFQVRCNGS